MEITGGHGAADAAELDALNDLLLPLVKGYCSEKAYELLAVSLQCFGGSGYLQDYPMEQYIRDQKIDTLYEGTTHIQALDLLHAQGGARRRGDPAGAAGADARRRPSRTRAARRWRRSARRWARRWATLEAMLGALMGKLGESLYHVGLQGNRVLFPLAELVIGWLLVRHAAVALKRAKANPGDTGLLRRARSPRRAGSAREVLPNIAHDARMVEQSRLELMEVPDEAF